MEVGRRVARLPRSVWTISAKATVRIHRASKRRAGGVNDSERRFRGAASAAVTGCAIGVASGPALGGLRQTKRTACVLPDTSPVSVSLAPTPPLAPVFTSPPWPPWASAETVAKMTRWRLP